MADERCTFLDPEPFVGPETLADFTRGLKAVAALRADLLESVTIKASEVVALEKEIARATSYIDVLKGSFNVCPPIMASTDFRVMQMQVLDECAKTSEAWKLELDDKLSAAKERLDELTSSLFDMNEAVRLADMQPKQHATADFSSVIASMRAYVDRCPELAEISAAVEDLRDEAESEASKKNCPVCWERVSTHACVPCGHMYCERCVTTLHVCAACRGDVRQKIKIYY
jgi:Zinc finger, C3HC4 type (RING finger)